MAGSEHPPPPEDRPHQRQAAATGDRPPLQGERGEVRPSPSDRPVGVYFSSTRVPRIFCEVIEFKNDGSSRSINSKNDDSAGVWVFWL